MSRAHINTKKERSQEGGAECRKEGDEEAKEARFLLTLDCIVLGKNKHDYRAAPMFNKWTFKTT